MAGVLLPLSAVSQQAPETPPAQPQVKVNMLNVCTPSAEEQKEIASALARVPKQPLFGDDFEISHGRSTLSEPSNFLQPGSGTHMAYEPLFRSASEVLANYRKLLAVQRTVPAELAQIPGAVQKETPQPKSPRSAAKPKEKK